MMSCLAALLLAAASPLDSLPPVSEAGARAFVVRHAQAWSNLDPRPDVSEDQLDSLTDLGREQAAIAAEALAGRGVRLILSSPAGRARQTATLLAAALGVEMRIELRLRPLEMGRGPTGDPLSWDDRHAEWSAERDPSPPEGESLTRLGERVLAVVRELPAATKGGAAVLVAHSEVIAAFFGHLDGTPAYQRLWTSVGNGSISVVDVVPEAPPRLRLRDFRPAGPPPD